MPTVGEGAPSAFVSLVASGKIVNPLNEPVTTEIQGTQRRVCLPEADTFTSVLIEVPPQKLYLAILINDNG